MSFPEAAGEARRLLNEGAPERALAALRAVLEYPGDVEEEARWREAFELLGQIAGAIEGPDLAGTALQAARDPNDLNALYDLAYELYEEGLFGVAATCLTRAHALAPEEPQIASELCANLEHLRRNEEARRVLRGAGDLVERDPLCRYLLAFHAIMCADLEEAAALLPALRAGEGRIAHLAAALDGMLARAEALGGAAPLDERDLRGWHMVLNGCALLHLAPEGSAASMGGRYGRATDSYALLREGLERLGSALEAAGLEPPQVIALPDRACRVLARAAAAHFGLPYRDWPEGGTEDAALIVAYDLDHHESLDVLEHLRRHRPGQVLWAHASCWTRPFPYAPDLTTFLYERVSIPWASDPAAEEEIAERILAAEPPSRLHGAGDVAALLRAARQLEPPYSAGVYLDRGPRHLQRIGGPVPARA